jgi:oligosaccharyltransferase complex subunit delta (ribophorin II)
MRTLFRGLLCVLSALTATAAATSWSFSDATLAVGPKGKDGTSSYTYSLIRTLLKGDSFTKSSGIDEVLELSPADTLRLAFTATLDDKASRPHQSFILIQDPSSPLQVVVPVPVKPSGKAKIDIDHRDIPPQLLYVDTLQLSLVVASFGDSTPLKVGVVTVRPVTNEASPTKPEEPERWLPKPEITHTFRAPQKLPNKQLSLLFSAAVAAGLPLFFVLVFPL